MKKVKIRIVALLLSCCLAVLGTVGSYEKVQAAEVVAGMGTLEWLYTFFMSVGFTAGAADLLNQSSDEELWNYWDEWHKLPNQEELDAAEEKISKLYYGATEAYKKNHGGGSLSPTPVPSQIPDPPVTVKPVNPEDLEPLDWATIKQKTGDTGFLAMSAATAYCLREAVKGWWDDIMKTDSEIYAKENPYKNDKYIGYTENNSSGVYQGTYQIYNKKIYVYDISVNSELSYMRGTRWEKTKTTPEYYSFYAEKSDGQDYRGLGIYEVKTITYSDYRGTVTRTDADRGSRIDSSSGSYDSGTEFTGSYSYTFSVPVVIGNQTIPASVLPTPKSSIWPSIDLKDAYDKNQSLSYPEVVNPPVIRVPTIQEIRDLNKQGTDDEENRPTYVTNFITNHTVQATPTPEPTKKPDAQPTPTIAVAPGSGGNTKPDAKPTTTPAVAPDPGTGDGTDPKPTGSPGTGGGTGTDPENPDKPDDSEIADYKTDLRLVFPFCIPFDLIHLFEAFDAEPEAPVFKIPIELQVENPFTGSKIVDFQDEIVIDLSDYEQAAKVVRILEVIAFLVGLMLITRQQMIKG